MSKNRSHSRPTHPPDLGTRSASPPATPGQLGWTWRVVLSVALVWHLAAVFIAPMSIPPLTSPLALSIVGNRLVQGYLDALYLNHGYHFFAPDPGPGHLVRYELTDLQGSVVAEGQFPDRDAYWPRLRYHRYFMLADQAELPLPNTTPDAAQQTALRAYARHLLRTHHADRARLTRVRHFMLSPEEKLAGVDADDPRKFRNLVEVVQRSDDLTSPALENNQARGTESQVSSGGRSYR